MQAHPRSMESAHASPSSSAAVVRPLSPSADPLSPSVPAAVEHDSSSPGPYWPRLARALVLMFFAISLHVWGVQSPDPQEPFYSTLAARFIASVLVSPPVPLAPPLQITGARTRKNNEPHVTLETTVLRVPSLPGPPARAPIALQRVNLTAVGTSGTTAAAPVDTADVASPSGPSVPAMKADADVPATKPPLEPPPLVSPPAAQRTSLPAVAAAAVRPTPRAEPVRLPPDHKEPDPREVAADRSNQTETVLAVVREYKRALERLDVRATKAVYPSANGRELQRAFQGLEEQRIHFASCGVSISSSGDDANARCKGNATYRPKVGSRVGQLTNREWVFSLARDGSGWQILEARTQ